MTFAADMFALVYMDLSTEDSQSGRLIDSGLPADSDLIYPWSSFSSLHFQRQIM
jgi:hypothetical protein